jgi:hypothetical protein
LLDNNIGCANVLHCSACVFQLQWCEIRTQSTNPQEPCLAQSCRPQSPTSHRYRQPNFKRGSNSIEHAPN